MIFLIIFKNIDATVSVSIFASIQFIYLTIIVWFRPYRLAKDNLMELVNELLFSTILGMLWCYHKKEQWTDTAENAYIGLVISNSGIIMIITFLDFASSCFSKWPKKKDIEKTVQISNAQRPRQNLATSNVEILNSSQISNNIFHQPNTTSKTKTMHKKAHPKMTNNLIRPKSRSSNKNSILW